MAKIGRNAPCPCGSGKKYKKCCLATDEAAWAAAPVEMSSPRPGSGWAEPDDPHDDWLDDGPYGSSSDLLSYYDPDAGLMLHERDGLRDASDEELVQGCAALGIAADADAFAAAASRHLSVSSLVDEWCAARPGVLTAREERWLEDAAWQLWRRRDDIDPCAEMVNEALSDGLALTVGPNADATAAATELLRAWDLADRALSAEVQTTSEAEDALDMMFEWEEWLVDLECAVMDARADSPGLVRRFLDANDAWLRRFERESSVVLARGHAVSAELCMLLNEDAEAQRRHDAIVARWPELAGPRLHRAAALRSHPNWPQDGLPAAALAELLAARDRPALDHHLWSLDDRIEELFENDLVAGEIPDRPEPVGIVAHLSDAPRAYPRAAIDAAVERHEEVIPLLIQVLDDAARSAEAICESGDAPLFAILLLGHLRYEPAHDVILSSLRGVGAHLPDLLGDAIDDVLPLALHRTSGGSTERLMATVGDAGAPWELRGAAADALGLAVAAGFESPERVAETLMSCIEAMTDDARSPLAGCLVCNLLELGAAHLADRIEAAYARGIVDVRIVNPRDVRRAFLVPKAAVPAGLKQRVASVERDGVHGWIADWAWLGEPNVLPVLTSATKQTPKRTTKPKKKKPKRSKSGKRSKPKGRRRR